jgi:hypothetical protein
MPKVLTPDERRVNRRKKDTRVVADTISGAVDGMQQHLPPFAILIGLMAATERYMSYFARCAEEQFGEPGKKEAMNYINNGLASLTATASRLATDTSAEPPTMVEGKPTTQTH